MEPRTGGRWRFVHVGEDGSENGFQGAYREVTAPERVVQTFEWEGMAGHVCVETTTFEDIGDGRTKVTTVSVFHTTEERDGMLGSRHGGRHGRDLRAAGRAAGQARPDPPARPAGPAPWRCTRLAPAGSSRRSMSRS